MENSAIGWTHEEDRVTAYRLLKACPVPRDRLPYTPEFEGLYTEFLRLSGRTIDRCVFWRLLSGAAKRGGLARNRHGADQPSGDQH